MSQFVKGLTRTFVAGGSINAKKGVRLSSSEDNTVHHCTAATTMPMGVALNSASDGELVAVQMNGTAPVIALRNVGKGNLVACGTAGKCAHTTTANNKVLGVAVESASAGDVCEIDLNPRGSNY